MPSPYGSSGGGSSPYATKRTKKTKSHEGFLDRLLGPADEKVGGFAGNLVGDIKDSVVGIPAGIKLLATDPKRAGREIAGATWHTWSPLFHGDFTKFGKQFYDHPLAPLLDVATVFTLGAGSAARGASALSKAGVGGARTAKIAGLRQTRAIDLPDPTGRGRPSQERYLSNRAGRRIVQETVLQLDDLLPQWAVKPRRAFRYERAQSSDMAHRVAAKNWMMQTALQAAKTLNDETTAPRARMEIATGMYTNLLRHNTAYLPEDAVRLVKKNREYRFITSAENVDRTAGKLLRKARRLETKWDRQRSESAEMAHALPKIEKELEHARRELARMGREGYIVGTPAKTKLKEPTPKQIERNQMEPVVEQYQLVKRLESQLATAHKAKGDHNKAVGELDALKRSRMDLEQRSFVEYFKPASESGERFERFVETFGSRMTTKDITRAAKATDGRIYVVPVGDARKLGIEARDAHRFMRWAWHRPTQLWKTALLGYTPRIVTNNAVGNWFIYAAREGGDASSIKGLHDAMRITHGKTRADEALMAATPFKRNHWMYRYFGDEMGNTFRRELDVEGGATKSRLRKIAREGFYPLVHKVSDEPVRMASISAYLRRSPEVKTLMKQGLDFDRAAHRALRHNPNLQGEASAHVRATAGDYVTLSPLERRVRAIMPFYLWNRHILKTTGNMALDTPGRVALLQKISNEGIEETEKWLGELPEFLRGALPFSKDGGRAGVALTHSLNPFATVGELAGMAEAATTGGGIRPGAALLGQTHPFLTTGGEFVFKQNLLTGAPKRFSGGFLTALPIDLASKLPQVQTGQELLAEDTTKTPRGNDLLYGRNETKVLSSLFGVPIRDVSLERARDLAAKEDGKKKKRRRKRRKSNPYG